MNYQSSNLSYSEDSQEWVVFQQCYDYDKNGYQKSRFHQACPAPSQAQRRESLCYPVNHSIARYLSESAQGS